MDLKPTFISPDNPSQLREPRAGDNFINEPDVSFDNISDLTDYKIGQSPRTKTANVMGYYSAGDGGGGTFYWDSTEDKANHNGGTIINPSHKSTIGSANWYSATGDSTDTTGSGCWVQDIKAGSLYLENFGVTKNNNSLNTVLQSVINYATENAYNVRLGSFSHTLTEEIILYRNVRLIGGQNTVIDTSSWNNPVSTSYIIDIVNPSGTNPNSSRPQKCIEYITIDNGGDLSSIKTNLNGLKISTSYVSLDHVFVGNGLNNGFVLGDISYINQYKNIRIQKCDVGFNVPSGLTDVGENHTFVSSNISENNWAVDNTGKAIIYFENTSFDYNVKGYVKNNPAGGGGNRFRDIIFSDCHFESDETDNTEYRFNNDGVLSINGGYIFESPSLDNDKIFNNTGVISLSDVLIRTDTNISNYLSKVNGSNGSSGGSWKINNIHNYTNFQGLPNIIAQETTNVPNGDFETGDLTYWGGSQGNVSVQSSDVQQGTYSLSVSGDGAGTGGYIESSLITIPSGTNIINLQFWAKNNSTSTAFMRFRVYEYDGTQFDSNDVGVTASSGWTRYQQTIDIDRRGGYVKLAPTSGDTSTDAVLLDFFAINFEGL